MLGSCLLALILTLPALSGNAAGVPVAFFAVVSIGVIGLYIAYVIPVYLRWRKGDAFKPGAWTLGDEVRGSTRSPSVWVIVTSIYFCLPFYGPPAVWWDDAVRLERRQLHPARAGRPGRSPSAWPGSWA